MKTESAPDVQSMMEEVIGKLSMPIDTKRVVCMRTLNSKSNAYARIWAFPKIWQKALGMPPVYVIEVISQHFDKLGEEEKQKTIIHELLHIPKTFSGGLVPHQCFGQRIDKRRVEKIFREFKQKPDSFFETDDGIIEMR